MTQTPLAKPRRQIGPDAILMLRNFSLQHTGDRFAYDACRVQRNRFGGPVFEMDFGNLETLEADHPESYGTLISRRVLPTAKALASRIGRYDPTLQHHEFQRLLKVAQTEDSEAWWWLSAAPLRSMLFPLSYDKDGRRADRIVYRDFGGDTSNRGKAVYLTELSAGRVKAFALHVAATTYGILDLPTITPIQRKELIHVPRTTD